MLSNVDFLELLLKPKKFTVHFKEIINKITKTSLYTAHSNTPVATDEKVKLFFDIPDYLAITFQPKDHRTKVKKLTTYKGSFITLSNYKNLEEYLKCNFSHKKRYSFRHSKKILEKCFNIHYKVYYGAIEKSEYDRLFEIFPQMIKKRFDLLRLEHHDLTVWDRYAQNGFSLINNKKAVLFVIYDGNTPISIALNPVLHKAMYGYIRAFDIDYSKFYVGFIDLILQLEWCFNNNMEVFDLLKGFYSYKSNFTDNTYYFTKYIVYNPRSLTAITIAYSHILKTKSFYFLIRFLKKIKVDILYHNTIKKKQERKNVLQRNVENKIIVEHNVALDASKDYFTVALDDAAYAFLKKPVYDFLYINQESINSIEVIKLKDITETYLIKGLKGNQKLTFITTT